MKSEFTAEFFQGNRQRLRALFTGTAPIVLTANGLLQRSTDTANTFKQDGSFWYLTGVNEPNVILVIDKSKEYLIVPDLSETRVAFDGAINADELAETSGIDNILSESEGWKILSAKLKKVKNVAVLSPPPKYIASLGMYTNPARGRLIEEMKKVNPELTLLDLRQHLQRMRMIKQPEELATIKHAIGITVDSLKIINTKYQSRSYKNEFEIELELSEQFWRKGASGHSFEPIVANGSKAATIHPSGNTGAINYDEPLLVDVGAQYNNYAADISRTWLPENKRYEAVYASVLEAANFAASLLKPGVIMQDYEKQVEVFMGEKLRELGLIKSIEHDAVRQYFPHSTSHFLGIDVHDEGNYELPLEPGVVLTVEPGIYIPSEGIGVRIEDDVLITDKGCTNLSVGLAR